ncbi:hypothetical protein [Psychrobacter ciconiae]|uniref:hypothetical protein n=1 Tax=Psychrobacter ciconiae TaxID=1553449 RepID=UPI001919F948|nr:hypothetical protein [Psychrobacter ciconiae]
MVASSQETRQDRKSYRRQALIWLMMTIILGVVTALVWMVNQTPKVKTKIENAPLAATAPPLETELTQPTRVEPLHELDSDVQPISFEDTVRDLRNYPDEFKDKSYLLANKGKWTVQVMNVAENDVVVSYLEGRDDRDKFSYFRYRDEDNQLRYMLVYGLMGSPQEAMGAAKLVDFGLPANVRVIPEEINRYVNIIDNYERPQPIKDLSSKRTRTVKLQPTKREVPVRPRPQPKPAPKKEAPATTSEQDSIKQSKNQSDTLSVNEERKIAEEAVNSADNRVDDTKKPPAVAAPKPPSDNKADNKKSDEKDKGKNDSLKGLIDEKSK